LFEEPWIVELTADLPSRSSGTQDESTSSGCGGKSIVKTSTVREDEELADVIAAGESWSRHRALVNLRVKERKWGVSGTRRLEAAASSQDIDSRKSGGRKGIDDRRLKKLDMMNL